MKHKVRVIQVYQVEREITVEVEAPTLEEAIDIQMMSDAPSEELDWRYEWRLQNEEVEPA